MPPLPPLGDPAAPRLLPLLPGTALRLANALLGDPDDAPRRFAQALRTDPPLALWTICRADADGAAPLRTPSELAGWLSARAIDAFRWDGAASAERGEACADRDLYSASLLTAELAAQLAVADRAEEARLLGLIHNARGWLSAYPGNAAPDRSQPTGVGWLDGALRRARGRGRPPEDAAGCVRQAREILSGEARCPSGLGFDRRRARREAGEAYQRWTGGGAEAVDLPALTGRLRQLRDRDGEFDERLEAEKLAAMAEFAAGAGHEINNPIAVISGRAQLLGRGEADPQRKRDLALIGAQARRVYEMIADMMLFARPPRPEFRPVDLGALLDEAWPRWQASAEQRGFRLARTGDAGPLIVTADRDQLLVAVGALLDNALQLEQGSLVEIGAARLPAVTEATRGNGAADDAARQHQEGPYAQLTVRDDGPGIAPETRRHLFDPYFSGRAAGRGLGLGLSKCWRIVTSHGGRLTVASRPGQGSEFTLLLPVEQDEARR